MYRLTIYDFLRNDSVRSSQIGNIQCVSQSLSCEKWQKTVKICSKIVKTGMQIQTIF